MIELEPSYTDQLVTYELQNPVIRSTWIGRKEIRIIAMRSPRVADCMHIGTTVTTGDMARIIANCTGQPLNVILSLDMNDYSKLCELLASFNKR